VKKTSVLSVLLAGCLLHAQLVVAGGCDLPMFAGARLFGAASGSQFMATGDFNHDGLLDVATSDGNNTLSILLGNGDGTFQPAVSYTVPQPKSMAVADFNGDGKLDLAVWSSFSTVVLLGNGDGTFKAPIAASPQGGAQAVGDFNGDGKPDLAITGSPVYILLGKGDGTFQPPIFNSNALFAGFGVAAGDFNGDGKLDVIAGSQDGIFVMLGDGKGNLSNPVDIGFGANPTQVMVGDFNGDKKLDVAVLDSLGGNFWVLLGKGDGTFQAATSYPTGAAQALSTSILVADLNGDGILDLAVTGQTPLSGGVQFLNNPGTILVFSGNGDGTFQPAVQYNGTGQVNWALAAGDFNGDGLPDLAFVSNRQSTPTQVGVMFGTPGGTFLTPASYGVGSIPGLPALADLNGDGVLDMVVANAGFSGNLSVLIGNGDGTFQPAVTYPTAFGAGYVVVGDFNGDGKPDIAVGNGTASNILVFPGNGDGTFRAPVASFNVIGGATYLAAGDFNKDGKLDLAVLGSVGVQIALGNGDGTFHGNLSLPGVFGASGPMAVADLNGDGNLDIVFTASNSTGVVATVQPGTVLVMLGHGDGTFATIVSYTIGKTATWVAIGDLNGDGKPDLAVADYAPGAADVAVLIGNGDGTFQTAVKYPVVNGADSVVMGDFNGDGNLDLAVASNSAGANSSSGSAGAVTVLLGRGDGTFRNSMVYGAGVNPLSVAMGDVNGDGKPDLVFADNLANSVVVLLNNYIPGSNSGCSQVQPLGN
jgi:FG-GAP-like repeat